jgi:GrpB-like predicted nucleotidyltransferase (UPF0157 family)
MLRVVPRPVIAPYDPSWPLIYEQERAAIVRTLGGRVLAIEHVGSTAVAGLGAKPIVDILAGLTRLEDAEACIEPLAAIGYDFVPRAMLLLPDDRYFERWTGGFERGTEIAHLHLTQYGAPFWRDHIRFRDLLRDQPKTAAAYEQLKRQLARRYTSGATYTAAKTEFIVSVLATGQEQR